MKPLLRKATFIFAIYIQVHALFGQISDCDYLKSEKIQVHLPSRVLISGEELIYHARVYNTRKNTVAVKSSQVIYFNLFNAQGEKVHSWRASLHDGQVTGSTVIPDTLKNGFYMVFAFTNFSRNFGEDSRYYSMVYVGGINDVKENTISVPCINNHKTNKAPDRSYKNQPNVSINTNKEIYSNREELRLTITPGNVQETDTTLFSVSVSLLPPRAIDTFLFEHEASDLSHF